ncbi:MAG: DUF4249 domain-containing protein [Prevotella sp.]|nr:DUF4249 domain-containing protein [Prevotella sp.]
MKSEKLYMILCLIVVMMLSGCIDEFDADIPTEDSDLLVVEGTIYSERMNVFTLSYTQPINSSSAPRMVMGAKVSVRGTDGSEYVAQQTDGNYSTYIGPLDPDVEYYLHIETDGDVYESEPQKPLRTEKIADVRGVQDTPESNIDVLITPDAPFEPGKANYYSWTYDETWEVHSDYRTTVRYDIEQMKEVIDAYQFPWRGWKDATSTTIMVGASSNYEDQRIRRLKIYDIGYYNEERMYYRYSGLVHQRSISKAEYEYELARRQASSEMGGLFTPQPSSLPTNIRCLTSQKHVIGFVGCALNTSEYRFFLDAEDYAIHTPVKEDARQWFTNPEDWLCRQLIEKGLFLCEWFTSGTDGSLQTAWAYEEQLDVRYKGAYIEEPDFWSLTENVSY